MECDLFGCDVEEIFILKKLLPFLPLILLVFVTGCTLPTNSNREESYAYQDTEATRIGKSLQLSRSQGIHGDGFVLLDSGLDAFVARATLADMADRSIDVQYYLYHDDLVGKLFTAVLLKAADRGVRVRVLIDDMDMSDRDDDIIAFDHHPNIQVRIFNPFNRDISRNSQFITGFGSVTRRMHNKSFTVDNVASILGGRNIGNEYFAANSSVEFADLDVLAVGAVVKDVSRAFDLYWNNELAYPAKTIIKARPTEEVMQASLEKFLGFFEEEKTSEYITALKDSDLAKSIRRGRVDYYIGNATVLVDHPDKIASDRDASELQLRTQLKPYFDKLEQELIIVSPYFVPGKEGVEFLKELVDRGVKVVILTNSLASNDVAAVHAGYKKYRKDLLRAGVELYEMNKKLTRAQRKQRKRESGSSKASLHAKTFVLDRSRVFIGSLNLDPRSFYENSEIGLILESPEVAGYMATTLSDEFQRDAFRLELRDDGKKILWHGFENGTPVTFDSDPYASLWRRFSVSFLSFLPIESQL